MSDYDRPFSDPHYAPENKTAREDEAREEQAGIDALAEWLAEQTWSEFATSLAEQHKAGRQLSEKQIAAGNRMWATMKAKAETAKAETAKAETAKAETAKAETAKAEQEPAAADTGLDLTDLPAGYYAIPNGDTRLKVRISRPGERSRWHGHTFVDDGAEYGSRRNYGRQAPGGTYQGDIADALRALIADPRAGARRYAELTGRCGMCNRPLEDEDSVAAGIGPICAAKAGR